MNWYLTVLQNYAVFNGRARRKEYWMFLLINCIFAVALGFVEGVTRSAAIQQGQPPMFGNLYELAVLLPSIAVGVRRMHDTNRSGWFILIPIYNFILACAEGTQGQNRFGPDPKTEERAG
jgi:uncharacterized membrane protein YhaH (DUF805 family)